MVELRLAGNARGEGAPARASGGSLMQESQERTQGCDSQTMGRGPLHDGLESIPQVGLEIIF